MRPEVSFVAMSALPGEEPNFESPFFSAMGDDAENWMRMLTLYWVGRIREGQREVEELQRQHEELQLEILRLQQRSLQSRVEEMRAMWQPEQEQHGEEQHEEEQQD